MADIATIIHNERTKLTATWINGLAIAMFAVGSLAPLFSSAYGTAPVTFPLIAGIIVCFAASSALHYWARRTLKGLRE